MFMRTCCTLALLLSVTLTHAEALPRPDHVVVVIEENRGYSQIMDSKNSHSYIHALAKRGMLFTQSFGTSHPSQPNYLAFFSGSTQGITTNECLPFVLKTDNLASALLDKGVTFVSYADGLPQVGDTVCADGAYRRKHNPIVNWQGARVSAELNQRFADFPQDFATLPTVSLVVPNQDHDMHDGSFETADAWLKTHIDPYVEWAFKHNSLLILTWDEDDYHQENHIVTLLVGPMVQTGISDQKINHYNVLRTLLDFYQATPMGESKKAAAINGIWRKH
ncbi:MAG: alkaline phosphatase family protein [Gallionella sp.]|nr:alkaline phosphatase family protein [Gallionella sp.]MDD4959160.1 alkaline phosphatase family protein [Gallionella sp.]